MTEAKYHIEPHRAVFILVGCKLDLKDQREVPEDEARSFAEFHEMPFIETSARTGMLLKKKFLFLFNLMILSHLKTGENVEEVFSCAGKELF